jgi:hypothetical protein
MKIVLILSIFFSLTLAFEYQEGWPQYTAGVSIFLRRFWVM